MPKAQVGQPYSQQIAAFNGTPPYTFTAVGLLSEGLSLSTSGLVSGTPAKVASEIFAIRVTDSRGVTDEVQMDFTARKGNLLFEDGILPPALLGDIYSHQIPVSGGTPPYTFSFLNLDFGSGVTLSSSGLISGTLQSNPYYGFATIKVDDSAGNSAAARLALVVSTNPLRFNTTTLAGGTVGTPYGQQISLQTSQLGTTIRKAFGPDLPPGLTINSQGVLSGTPLYAGSYKFNIYGQLPGFTSFAIQSFTMVVNPPFSLASPTSVEASLGLPYSSSLTLSGGFAPFRFSVVSGMLPPGISLSSTGQLTGTPNQAGVFNPLIRVSDSQNRALDFGFTFRITDNALQLSIAPSTTALLYTSLNFQPITSGGRPPYTYTLVSNPLIPGLTFNASTGVISGTPVFPWQTTATLRVRDSAGVAKEAGLTLSTPRAMRLPAASAGTDYNYRFSDLSNASLITLPPAGLKLTQDGILSGTPLSQGDFPVVVSGRNLSGLTVNLACNLHVQPARLQLSPLSLPSAAVGASYSQTLTARGFTGPPRWSVVEGSLPPGLQLNSATGAMEGSPTTAAYTWFTVQAADNTSSARATHYFTVSPAGAPQLDAIASAANYDSSGTAGGEILVAFGRNLGPDALTTFRLINNAVPSTLAGVTVHFDTGTAPILYAQANQLSFIAPYAISAFDPIRVVVESSGLLSAPFLLLPRLAKPALFTVDGSGSGPASLLNENGSVNSSSNPAEPESIIVVYLTGIGPMIPPGRDGAIATVASTQVVSPAIRISGQPAQILYMGNAPGLVHGVAQANLRLPQGTISGQNEIEISIGGNSTSTRATVWIR